MEEYELLIYHRLKYGSNSEEKVGIRIVRASGVFSSLLNERTTCLE